MPELNFQRVNFKMFHQLTSEQRGFLVEQSYSNKSPTKVKIAFADECNQNINVMFISDESDI